MNKAESQRVADYLELLGYKATLSLRSADLVVLNTCVVRQSAEDKVLGTLGYVKGIKNYNPDLFVLVTGCFVDSNIQQLKKNFPHVDLFFKPGDYVKLVKWADRLGVVPPKTGLPLTKNATICAFVPIIQGCDNFCSYCIVPYRRGREKSRPVKEIVCEVDRLVSCGTKEITLLGQNVNSYGHDLPRKPDLSDLLTEVNSVDGLVRIRFLTNHPKDMSQKLIKAIASLGKVCEHVSLPLQSGDDDILKAMNRGYTVEQYRQLIHTLRSDIPEIAISTDVIVGFPGESDEQFDHTLAVLEKIRFDTVHVAAYSPRLGTIASREYRDNVPSEIKKERLNKVEALQAGIAGEINSGFQGTTVEILVDGKKREKWYGRTRGDKLAFFENSDDYLGQMVYVTITKTSPWALQGTIAAS
jgi:tRNA-2-methylthio-N6-dimethylallyladenosine synthase